MPGKDRVTKMTVEQKACKVQLYAVARDLKHIVVIPVPRVRKSDIAPTLKKLKATWAVDRKERIGHIKSLMLNLQKHDGSGADVTPQMKKVFLAFRDEVLALAFIDIARPPTHDAYFEVVDASKGDKKERTVTVHMSNFASHEEMDRVYVGPAGDGRYDYPVGPRVPRTEAAALTDELMASVTCAMQTGLPANEVAELMQHVLGSRNKSVEVANMYNSHRKFDRWPIEFNDDCMEPIEMILSVFLKSLGRNAMTYPTSFDNYVLDDVDKYGINSKIKDVYVQVSDVKCSTNRSPCCACGNREQPNQSNTSRGHSCGTSVAYLEDLGLSPRNVALQIMVQVGRHMCARCLNSWLVVVNAGGLRRLLLALLDLSHPAKITIIDMLDAKCVSLPWTSPVYPTEDEPMGTYGIGGICRLASFDDLAEFMRAWLNYNEQGPLTVQEGIMPMYRSHTKKMQWDGKQSEPIMKEIAMRKTPLLSAQLQMAAVIESMQMKRRIAPMSAIGVKSAIEASASHVQTVLSFSQRKSRKLDASEPASVDPMPMPLESEPAPFESVSRAVPLDSGPAPFEPVSLDEGSFGLVSFQSECFQSLGASDACSPPPNLDWDPDACSPTSDWALSQSPEAAITASPAATTTSNAFGVAALAVVAATSASAAAAVAVAATSASAAAAVAAIAATAAVVESPVMAPDTPPQSPPLLTTSMDVDDADA